MNFLVNMSVNTYNTDVTSSICCVLQKSRNRDGFHAGGLKDSSSSCLETGFDPRVAFQQVGWTVGAGSMDSPHLDLAGA